MGYCQQCQKTFPSPRALQQHLQSPKHRVPCERCQKVFASVNSKWQHEADSPNHHICFECPDRRDFVSSNNLKQHSQIHDPRSMKCYGCNARFRSTSGMLLHLESGACECQVNNNEIEQLAFDCNQSEYYTRYGGGFPFACPTCETQFSYMSGLFQHVESDACEETSSHGTPLGRFEESLQSMIQDNY